MAGGYIIQRIDENLTYDYLHSSEDNLWSMLYLTGYLTKLRENDYEGELLEGTMALIIPNAEIKEIFETLLNGLMTVQKNGIEMLCLMRFGMVTVSASQKK